MYSIQNLFLRVKRKELALCILIILRVRDDVLRNLDKESLAVDLTWLVPQVSRWAEFEIYSLCNVSVVHWVVMPSLVISHPGIALAINIHLTPTCNGWLLHLICHEFVWATIFQENWSNPREKTPKSKICQVIEHHEELHGAEVCAYYSCGIYKVLGLRGACLRVRPRAFRNKSRPWFGDCLEEFTESKLTGLRGTLGQGVYGGERFAHGFNHKSLQPGVALC